MNDNYTSLSAATRRQMTTNGKRLTTIRAHLDISRQELADLSGVSFSALRNFELGITHRVHMDTFNKVCAAMSINPDWILGDQDGMSPFDVPEKKSKVIIEALIPTSEIKVQPVEQGHEDVATTLRQIADNIDSANGVERAYPRISPEQAHDLASSISRLSGVGVTDLSVLTAYLCQVSILGTSRVRVA